jgi:NADH:ubiquinone oxidoreductase subunit 3 (subunit A)
LFVLFDVEIALLFPWAYALGRIDYWSIRSVLIFFYFNAWFCLWVEVEYTWLKLASYT